MSKKDSDAEHAFSTPWDAQLIPDFPFTYRNAEVMTLVYRTNPEAIAALLPPPLESTSDLVLIHIYNMHDVEWLGCYGECNVMVGARIEGKAEGGYSPYLFLDSDAGIAQGREVHGQPKKYARPKVALRQDLLVGVVERNGIEFITGTMGYKCKRGSLDALRSKLNFVVNLNYAKHVLESKMPTPQEPVVFMKNPAAAIGHNENIRIPKVCGDELDFEGESAVVIGKACRDVERKDVNSVIRGYCVANDISARIWQLQRGGSQWVRGKSFDSFAPLGPFIVTPDEIEDPGGLAICTKVNDQTMQNSNTADMIFDVPALVSFCSQDTMLLPGTVIMTGTPEGVGWTRQTRVTLKAGHQISVEIEGLG